MPADVNPAVENHRIAVELSNKYESYFIALIFTLLGLAVQTAKVGRLAFADVFELSGWLMLALAGLLAMYRLETAPQVYKLFGLQTGQESLLSQLKQARLKGSVTAYAADYDRFEPIAETEQRGAATVKKIREASERYQSRLSLAYRVQRTLFIAALFALMASRAAPAFFGALD